MDTHIPEDMRRQIEDHRNRFVPSINHDDELFGRNSTANPDDVFAASRRAEEAAQGEDWLDGVLKGAMLILSFIGALSIAMAIGLYSSGFFHWIASKMPDNKVLQFLFG